MTEPTAEQISAHIDKFTDIYLNGGEVNPVPKGIRVTVWCCGTEEQGYAYDTTWEDMGLEIFIAKKWVLQSELDELLGDTLAYPLPTAPPDMDPGPTNVYHGITYLGIGNGQAKI